MTYILEHSHEVNRLELQSKQKNYSLPQELRHLDFEKAGITIVDAGCGSGLISRFLAKHNPSASIKAFDFSKIRIDQAKELSQSPRYKNISFDSCNLESIPLLNESIDIVICRFVYEYLKDPLKITREFKRILKPDGIVYLIDVDGLFLNIWSQNGRFNDLISKLKKELDIDLYVGRKLSGFLHATRFKRVFWDATIHNFIDQQDIEQEYINNKDRLIFAKDQLTSILGDEETFNEFSELYLNEMKKQSTTLFFNKFVAWGVK